MIATLPIVLAVMVLAARTFAFRFAGPVLRVRLKPSPRAEKLMTLAAVVLLTALVATAAFLEGHEFADIARPTGVAVAGILAWRKAPFLAVVLAAAATAAGFRLVGVP